MPSSPFTLSNTPVRLSDLRVSSKLIVRVGDASNTDKVLFRLSPTELVSTERATGYLNAGESVEFCGETLKNAQDVSLVATSGTPSIYWGEI